MSAEPGDAVPQVEIIRMQALCELGPLLGDDPQALFVAHRQQVDERLARLPACSEGLRR